MSTVDLTKIYKTAVGIGYDWKDPGCGIVFKQKYHEWIHSSVQIVAGLPDSCLLTIGITDAFNQTYSLYNKIGVFPGEYGYHEMVFPDRVTTNLVEADVIIVSHPFSADGMSSHDKIEIADKLNKPIFIDCAFFGVCSGINFDFLKYENVHSVAFSLSKTFGTGRQRVGLLYTNDIYPGHVCEQKEYIFDLSAKYHLSLLDKTSPDEMPNRFKQQQVEICKELNVQPSDTVLFGLDYTDKFNFYKRHNVNRLCLTDLFK
jgi:hypothetical protein